MKVVGNKVYLTLGETLRLARLKNGRSAIEVARKLGWMHNTLYDYEADKHSPKLENAYALCKEYGMNIDTLCKVGIDGKPLDANEVYVE